LVQGRSQPGAKGGEASPEKRFALLTKSGQLTFKIVIKKDKNIKN